MTQRERISGLLLTLPGSATSCLGRGCGGVRGQLAPGAACFMPHAASAQLGTKCRTGHVRLALPPAQVGDGARGANAADGSENPDLKPFFDFRPSVSNSRPFIAGKSPARPAGHATQPHMAQLMSTELITKLGFLASYPQ